MRRLVGLILASSITLGAQSRPEAGLDVVSSGSADRAQVSAGFSVPMGAYVRSGVFLSHDVWQRGDRLRGGVEASARFLLDPLAASRWGLSFAGGIGVRDRPYMLFAAELEGPRMGRARPAVRVTLGAGTRVGVVMRAARSNRR